MFISTLALFISSGGQFAPAMIPVLIWEKSVFGKSEWLNMATNMVGTPLKQVIFSSVIQERDDLGEKYGIGQRVPPWVIMLVIERTMPKQWNIGTCIIILSAVDISILSPMVFPLLTIFLWVSMTPLGKPVVPDVYCMLHTSSGFTRDALLFTSSIGTSFPFSSISLHSKAPSISKSQVTIFLRKGSLSE